MTENVENMENLSAAAITDSSQNQTQNNDVTTDVTRNVTTSDVTTDVTRDVTTSDVTTDVTSDVTTDVSSDATNTVTNDVTNGATHEAPPSYELSASQFGFVSPDVSQGDPGFANPPAYWGLQFDPKDTYQIPAYSVFPPTGEGEIVSSFSIHSY